MNVIQNLLSQEAALRVSEKVTGMPTEDRILIAVPTNEAQTSSGLIIPTVAKDDVPKKGVIIGMGLMDLERRLNQHLRIGQIITFGLYAGKEIELESGYKLESQKFMVLSIEEVIYIESNNISE